MNDDRRDTTKTSTPPNNQDSMASKLASLFLRKEIEQGKSVEIPSLKITLKKKETK